MPRQKNTGLEETAETILDFLVSTPYIGNVKNDFSLFVMPREKIINYCENVFAVKGFYKTSIDSIATDLKMSKKTIYKYFPSKELLVAAVAQNIAGKLKAGVGGIIESDKNTVAKLHEISLFLADRISRINMEWLRDLQIRAPEIWKEIEKFRRQTIQQNLEKILNAGKKEGLIIDEPNSVMLTIIISSIQGIVNPEFILNNNLSVKNAVETTLTLLFNGMFTSQGKKYYKKYIRGLKG